MAVIMLFPESFQGCSSHKMIVQISVIALKHSNFVAILVLLCLLAAKWLNLRPKGTADISFYLSTFHKNYEWE